LDKANIAAQPTIVHRLWAQADANGSRPALRYREDGRWCEISWEEYRTRVLDVAGGLQSLGVESGDRVCLLSHNQPNWVIGDLGILACGAVSVPAYPNSIPTQVQYLLQHATAKVVLVANGEQLRKVQQVWSDCPDLQVAVLLDNDEALVEDGRVITFETLMSAGRAHGTDSVEDGLKGDLLKPEQMATIIYTSGTTGPPKGAMLSHKNLVFEADAILKGTDLNEKDSTLSFLPLSHVAERLQGELVGVTAGLTVNYAESMETILRDVGETNATTLLCVPRLWEKIYANIQSGIQEASPLKRRIFDWSMAVGTECFETENAGGSVGPVLSAKRAIADRLVFSKVRAKLGMTHTSHLLSGAAPLSATVGTFFASIGLRIQEAYGQTECVGVSNMNPPDRLKFGTVGPALEGVEVKIAEDGEILVRGDNVFLGYFQDEAATASALVDGWLLTGDIGEFDQEGYLKITDRKKDILVTAGGKNVAPQNIENQLKPFAGISQVVVVGDKRKFLSALVTLDLEEMAKTLDTDLPPMADCVDHKAVLAQVQGYIDQVNSTLASYETVKKFRLLPRDFSIEEGELTPTLKVKRRVVQKQYESLIDSMYDEKFE
jgi:long-chain acyl-CoA synthetase